MAKLELLSPMMKDDSKTVRHETLDRDDNIQIETTTFGNNIPDSAATSTSISSIFVDIDLEGLNLTEFQGDIDLWNATLFGLSQVDLDIARFIRSKRSSSKKFLHLNSCVTLHFITFPYGYISHICHEKLTLVWLLWQI